MEYYKSQIKVILSFSKSFKRLLEMDKLKFLSIMENFNITSAPNNFDNGDTYYMICDWIILKTQTS